MMFLDANILSAINSNILVAICSAVVSIITAYIMIRERVLKTEMKINAMTDYIDRKNDLINNNIVNTRDQMDKNIESKNALVQQGVNSLREDISDFKELNIRTTETLNQNTIAIRELKAVLDLLKDQLGVKAINRLKKTSAD